MKREKKIISISRQEIEKQEAYLPKVECETSINLNQIFVCSILGILNKHIEKTTTLVFNNFREGKRVRSYTSSSVVARKYINNTFAHDCI